MFKITKYWINYTSYQWARFGFCFKFLTLLVFETSGKKNQKTGKMSKISTV